MNQQDSAEAISAHRVAVIGLGSVGLPLALVFAKKGFSVIGIDTDRGRMKEASGAGRFAVSDNYNAICGADVLMICVPTPLTPRNTPDLSYLTEAGKQIVRRIGKGQLVILESSTYPGTTREVLQPILEKSGLEAGRDFFLAYSPAPLESDNGPNPQVQPYKVLGGITAACKDKAYRLYAQIYDKIVCLSTPEAAELAKLLENCRRYVQLSLMNEVAVICDAMRIDLGEILQAGGLASFGQCGVGAGTRVSVDPYYFQWKAGQYGVNSSLISSAMERLGK